MKVIFIKDLKNQGKKGEIKEVKDGYAKNFLIKNEYAVVENKINLNNLKKGQQAEYEQDQINKKHAYEIKKQLEKKEITFKVKTGINDKVFGSISTKQIKEKLDEKFKINKNQIIILTPITSLGYHNVEVNLYKDISAIIKIQLIK